MKNYVNLHTHGVFSFLDGYGKYEVYAQKVQRENMGAIGITEHGNIHGWMDFYETCKAYGVKPILGIEMYQARKSRFDRDEEERAGKATNEWEQRGPYHLTVHAKNKTGYNNLIKLSSRAYLEGYYVKPRIDYDLLDEHSEGLIILSGCLGGAVQQALMRDDYESALAHASVMQDIVGKENFFIEIQDHGLDEQRDVKEQTLAIAKTLGAKVIATGDCHYVEQYDHVGHDIMLAAGTKATINDENRFRFPGPEFYLKTFDEMAKNFEEEWLTNSCEVADMVDIDLSFGELHFPQFPDVPKEKTPIEFLNDLAWEGLKDKYGDPLPPEVKARATYELGVIDRMGFAQYFLVVGDLVRWAKDHKIRVGYGRGSGAGSIISYALSITNLDPLRFGLLFERFLIEGRAAPPDIDLDFDSRYRDQVIDYARTKYGDDHVAHIVTFAQEGARSAIRDATRVMGYPYEIGDKVSKLIPEPVLGVSKTITESMESPELAALCAQDEIAESIIDSAKLLEGVYRQTGVHAAGVIITPGPVTDYVPIMRKGEDKPVITQWGMDDMEKNGMLKVDFLGLRNLDVVDMAIHNIMDSQGIMIDPDDIPLDDSNVFESLSSGNTVGVFQLESPGMTEMTKDLAPESIEDIMALISLFRPGPLGSGMDKMYINRKHGRERVSYPHPTLETALENSRGIMLYQEDVLSVCRLLAGFDVAEADTVRKVIGKKQMDKVAKYREKFVKGAADTSGISEEVANKIYSDIEYFAGYGFNRAHAASYAMLSYVTAWLKFYYPNEYMAALLTSVIAKRDKLSLYLNECKKLDIAVVPPSVNESMDTFRVSKTGDILFGFSGIDGIGDHIISQILELRQEGQWNTIWDFFKYSNEALLNQGAIRKLIKSGALDEQLPDKPNPVFGNQERLSVLAEEKDHLGAYITGHPLDSVWGSLSEKTTHTTHDVNLLRDQEYVKVGGVLRTVTKRITRQGKPMYNIKLEDLTGDVDVVVYPTSLDRMNVEDLVEGKIGIIEGWVKPDAWSGGDKMRLIVRDFVPIDEKDLFGGIPIRIHTSHPLGAKHIEMIGEIIDNHPGDSPVYLTHPYNQYELTFKFKANTSYNVKETIEKLAKLGDASA